MADTPDPQFTADVRRGLTGNAKKLPCVYFYDECGSALFEQICDLPEYYCTLAETEILRTHAAAIASLAPDPLQVVELGSGNSVKTRHLLDVLHATHERVLYRPVDVSHEMLAETASELDRIYPRLSVRPLNARYEQALEDVSARDGAVLLLWLGSSIGNLERDQAADFLGRLCRQLNPGDQLLIGFDLIKSPAVLEAAYNDSSGITAAFNLNLLARINRELGGEFDLSAFRHRAVYNDLEDRIEMYLESRCAQRVRIAHLDLAVAFEAGERIHTENSCKYDSGRIATLAETAGMTPVKHWHDSRLRFSLNLFAVTSGGT